MDPEGERIVYGFLLRPAKLEDLQGCLFVSFFYFLKEKALAW